MRDRLLDWADAHFIGIWWVTVIGYPLLVYVALRVAGAAN